MGETAANSAARTQPIANHRAANAFRRVMAIDEIGVIVALVAICIFLTLISDKFLTTNDFIKVSRQASWFGIMAVGMVFVISMGDIDLSVSSILMLSSVRIALAIRDGYSIVLAVAFGLLVATTCGLVNGVLSVVLRIPTIIVTLGTLSLYRGLGLVVKESSPV